MTKVVNALNEAFDVSIMRPGPFGNPFFVGTHGTREECIEKFRNYVHGMPIRLTPTDANTH